MDRARSRERCHCSYDFSSDGESYNPSEGEPYLNFFESPAVVEGVCECLQAEDGFGCCNRVVDDEVCIGGAKNGHALPVKGTLLPGVLRTHAACYFPLLEGKF